ncbi:unnamed protein product [Rhodiola kirilowii]
MASNTHQATMADLEARTAALEVGLKDLTGRVDHNHDEMKQPMDELRKELREAVNIFKSLQQKPAPTKVTNRGKAPMIEESGVEHDNLKTGPELPPTLLDTLPRVLDGRLRGQPSRTPYIDPYIGEPMGTEGTGYDYRTRAWSAARDTRPRVVRAPDTGHRKLELPIFQGDDIHGWLHRAERYFLINGLTDYEKLDAASICFEGKALHWHQWREMQQPFRSWDELKSELSKRFRGQPGRVHEEFFALMQDSTVEAYRENFERLSVGLRGLPTDALVGTFMKGLKALIREGVRVHRPSSLAEAMHLAQLVEEEKLADRASKAPVQTNHAPAGGHMASEARERPRAPAPAPSGARRLTEADIATRRAQGLCLRCDE